MSFDDNLGTEYCEKTGALPHKQEIPKSVKTEDESAVNTLDCRLQEGFLDNLLGETHSPEFDELGDIVSDSLNSVPNVNSELFAPVPVPETPPEVVLDYVPKQKRNLLQ